MIMYRFLDSSPPAPQETRIVLGVRETIKLPYHGIKKKNLYLLILTKQTDQRHFLVIVFTVIFEMAEKIFGTAAPECLSVFST